MLYYTAFRVQDILSVREYYNLLVKKILFPIHHKICGSLYMSNHFSLICDWINCMPPLSCVRKKCFYYLFELTELRGGGGRRGGCECVPILCVLLVVKWTHMVGSLKKNSALEYSTRVVQEGIRRCKKSTLNDLAYLTPLILGSLEVF
jgi:hypothetical protein